MNVMIIGGGGREHAIARRLAESPRIAKLYALPGNGGLAEIAECAPVKATDIEGLVRFAVEKSIDFAVVTPDDPLVLGAADALRASGVRCFGPSAKAAEIEGSKSFAKALMKKYNIPTADFRVFTDADEARRYLKAGRFPAVIKADGLALGKGVIIAESYDEASEAIAKLMEERAFGESGARVVIEEYLEGVEVSVLALTDGETLIELPSAMDHKRALDGDRGANTGGMGMIAPNPFYTESVARECRERIFFPTLRALAAEGRRFTGCLYFGLMLTENGAKVIEYNCRFGDPETQAVLPLLQGDLFEMLLALDEGRLSELTPKLASGCSCCVVLASSGYPAKYETGFEIALNGADALDGVIITHAGTRNMDGRLVTAGGRVLNVTATGATLKEAVEHAYSAADMIDFNGKYCRRDIGARALAAIKES